MFGSRVVLNRLGELGGTLRRNHHRSAFCRKFDAPREPFRDQIERQGTREVLVAVKGSQVEEVGFLVVV